MIETLTLRRPDDWHCHFRDGTALQRTVHDTAKTFARALAMPNLVPPVTTVPQAHDYYDALCSNVPEASREHFQPKMTLYLTDSTTPETIKQASDSSIILAVKAYPAGATTNSARGITQFNALTPTLEAMQKYQLPLLLHGEVTTASVDIFDRETVFIDTVLSPLLQAFPELPVVLEHITTRHAVQFIESSDHPSIAATITAHHLLMTRNDLLVGGLKPDHYCLPVAKREEDRLALLQAACSGSPQFFLGTDSAPHTSQRKYSACGCAGIYTAHAALPLYAEAFESFDALDKLDNFASGFGADFYGLKRNQATITLIKQAWQVPQTLPFSGQTLTPFYAGKPLQWQHQ